MFDRLREKVKSRWRDLVSLDCQLSIWVEPEELGHSRVIEHRKKRYRVKIPAEFEKKVVVRLEGIGKARRNKRGDLYLHVWLNRGEDVSRSLWLPEALAREGGHRSLVINGRQIKMVIPARSRSGLVVRLRGLGKTASIPIQDPLLTKHRGDMLVKLFVYPETVTPNYGSFDRLRTEVMAQEGWIYRAIDEVVKKMGRASFPSRPMQAGRIADRFNDDGWDGIYRTLLKHLDLAYHNITVAPSATIDEPGSCQAFTWQQGDAPARRDYQIAINPRYLDSPFSVAAILAHELCHVIYAERIDDGEHARRTFERNQATWDMERTVDLLVCMYRLGEFRLRFARDSGCTLGYFDPVSFDRMQVIVSNRLDSI